MADNGNDERLRRQRMRSLAIALALAALVVLFYVATIVRLGPNALRKDGFSPPRPSPAAGPARGAATPADTGLSNSARGLLPQQCRKGDTC